MSAYVVEDETINQVLAWFQQDQFGPRKVATWHLKKAGFDPSDAKSMRGLGHEMFRLNIYAVDARYGDGEAEKFRPLDYEFVSLMPPAKIQALKSLQCLIYQCSEGDVVERPLYQMLRDIEFAICRDIVGSLPEYDRAAWA